MAYEMTAVLFGPKTIEGSAKNLNDVIKILHTELINAGFIPRQEVDAAGNCFRLKAGFGAYAKVHYRAVGSDVILTPEARAHSGWVIFLLCCICGCIPGIIGIVIRDRNVKKVIRRLPTILESTHSQYKSQFPASAPPKPTESESEALPAKHCVHCGTKLVTGAAFCPKCGKKVS
jgi:hypothetical protein